MHQDAAPPPTPGPRPTVLALVLAAAWILALTYITTQAEPAAPSSSTPTPPPLTRADEIRPEPVTPARLAKLPPATTFTTLADAPRDRATQATPSGLLIRPRRAVPLYHRPGGPALAALTTHQLGGPTWLPVIDTRPGWLRVLLPARPNGATAWLPRNHDLQLARTRHLIVVDRRQFTLTLHHRSHPTRTWTIGVGKPAAPTPRGRTFILSALRDPTSTFSEVVLPLGAHSDTHQTYGGGPGTVGIHTWPTTDVYGQAASDGCIRVPANALTVISTTVPIGTPVLIR